MDDEERLQRYYGQSGRGGRYVRAKSRNRRRETRRKSRLPGEKKSDA